MTKTQKSTKNFPCLVALPKKLPQNCFWSTKNYEINAFDQPSFQKRMKYLTHFRPKFPFFIPWKHQNVLKTKEKFYKQIFYLPLWNTFENVKAFITLLRFCIFRWKNGLKSSSYLTWGGEVNFHPFKIFNIALVKKIKINHHKRILSAIIFSYHFEILKCLNLISIKRKHVPYVKIS